MSMNQSRNRLVLILLLVYSLAGAQQRLNINFESAVSIGNNNAMPVWLYANEWGKYSNESDFSGIFCANGVYQLLNNDLYSLNVGAGIVVNTDQKTSFLHQAFIKGHVWFIDYSIGKETRSWVTMNDRLSTGHFLINQNARPIPRATVGLSKYRPLKFTKNWLEIKGGITQGILNDDRGERKNSANNVLLHEKWAYGRLGNIRLKPYAGIIHSVLFGGTRPNGFKIPVDFWPTFFAQGSSKIGGGDETNAAGAHMGLWDFGVYYSNDKMDLQFYWQKPFGDGSGMKIWNGRNKDRIIGIMIYPQKLKWLKGLSLEFIETSVQSGYGIPDPLYPVDYNGHKAGSIIWRDDIESDLDGFMSDVFGENRTGWGWKDAMRYMEVVMNEGYKFGGRDDYMNNGSYYNGWTYHGMSMGTPLYHTIEQVGNYYSGTLNNHLRFINNRVKAVHVGLEGNVSANLEYRLKSTYTINYGSYAEEFAFRYSWDRVSDYFFIEGKKQCYSMLEGVWTIPTIRGVKISGVLGYDFGQLYHSWGGRIGITYRPVL